MEQTELIYGLGQVLSKDDVYGVEIVKIPFNEISAVLLVTKGIKSLQENSSISSELVFVLPEYWNLEKDNWPLYWLERMAAIPQKFETNFGVGDTIPAGKPPKELAENFKANHFILKEFSHQEDLQNKLNVSEKLQFLSVIPIFQRECEFKLRNSGTVLLHHLKHKGVRDMVDIYRKPAVRRRILGLI